MTLITINSLSELPEGKYAQQPHIFTTEQQVEKYVKDFTKLHGEPSEGYRWQPAEKKIYVYLRKEEK